MTITIVRERRQGRRGRGEDARRLLGALLLLPCCSPDLPASPRDDAEGDRGRATQTMVYGDDDRVEAVDAEDPVWRARALRSVVALVRSIDHWSFCDAARSTWTAETLGERENLCAEEPLREQPVLAGCSGTLIDRDLVLTAQHCVGTDEACKGMRFVMGLYREEAGEVRAIPRSDVFSCKERVLVPTDRDIVIVRLDRPVGDAYEPAPVARGPFAEGTPLMAAGFPTGIPMKVSTACEILGHRDTDDGYLVNCDLFAGNSGSGFFDATGAILGVYYQGGGDYTPKPDADCYVRITAAEDGTLPGVPTPQLGSFTPAATAVDRMCALGVTSVLCDASPICGDGRCEGETPITCALDCPAPACGDATCDLDEDYTCAADCGARDRVAECGALPTGGGGAGGGGGGDAGGGGAGGGDPGTGGGVLVDDDVPSGGCAGCGGDSGDGAAVALFGFALFRRPRRARQSASRNRK